MRIIIKKWGNSASVRIPAAIMESASLSLDQIVEVREENGRVIIEPSNIKQYDLAELIEGITAKNQHREVDFGPKMGKETW